MNSVVDKVCVTVTAAFALTLIPGLRQRPQVLRSGYWDQGKILVIFVLLGSIEEAASWASGWPNERIVAACASGLLAGPWIGLIVGIFMTCLAVGRDGLPWHAIGFAMLSGGLIGGFLRTWRPTLAQHPLTGFGLAAAVSWLRDGLSLLFVPVAPPPRDMLLSLGLAPLMQGFGVALILAIVAQSRDRDEHARAAAAAEVRALQARMNPHFVFNALNALAALSALAPLQVPRVAARLSHFLRASFDQQDRSLISLKEELAVTHAYLEIESLRLGEKLKVQEQVEPSLTNALVPPFSLQPLVENAVQHAIQPATKDGHITLSVSETLGALEMSVRDDGPGVPREDVEQTFFGARPESHALVLLRRRLQALSGGRFRLDVQSDLGSGTTVTLRIPLLTCPARQGERLDGPLALWKEFV